MIMFRDSSYNKSKIAARTRNMNMLLLILVLALISVAAAVMISGVTSNASKNLARFYSIEAVNKFNLYISKDLALVQKVANSKAVTEWFADEENREKRLAAYNETMDYADLFQNAELYFGIQGSLNEFSVHSGATLENFVPYSTLDPSVEKNIWFYECMDSPYEYVLNIDIDKFSNRWRLWINHKVTHNGKIVGVFCSGLSIGAVLDDMFSQYDVENVIGHVIDKNGLVQMDSAGYNFYSDDDAGRIHEASADPAFDAAIDSYLKKIDGYFAPNPQPEIIRLAKGPFRYVSIAPIAYSDWSVVTLFNSKLLFSPMNFLPLFFVILAAFILYTLSASLLMSRFVLTPLKNLTESLSSVKSGENDIFGFERKDEFGELARTIRDMRDRLSVSNSDLSRATRKRERQAQLLHAVNRAAAVLLSSESEKTFEASLQEGMELMAGCVDVDRIYIWKNETINGGLYYVRQFFWMNETGKRLYPAIAETSFPYSNNPDLEAAFLRGECQNGPVSKMPQNMRISLAPFMIQSILLIPVYLRDQFWGFISFEDCRKERFFLDEEIDILRSASLMMASAQDRNIQALKLREMHERVQIMLDATPLSCGMWDRNLRCTLCNEAAAKLFRIESKQVYIDRFFDLSPEYQPDGQRSREKAFMCIDKAFRSGSYVFEWMHQMLDGTPIPAEITLVRVNYEGDYIVLGYTRDMREYKQIMKRLEQRDMMLQTVNQVAEILLQSEIDEFVKSMRHCTAMMAEAVQVDRVYIWKNYTKDGRLYCTQLFEWSEGAEPQQGNELTTDILYEENAPRWKEELSAGHCINNMVRSLPPGEQAALSPQGILSILVVPVFLRDQFWGFVGFDDCHSERVFSENEESILRSGSLLIANALLRNETSLNLRVSAEKLEAALGKAEAASHAKSNFLSNMSHEIRTPMNAIIGMTSIGKSAADLVKKNYAFEKIESASSLLLGIINDILEMSKIEAGKFELSDVEFNIEKLLQKIVNVINFRVDEKRQRLSVYLDKNIPASLVGDDQRLSQVLTNLLSNAIKFTPDEGSIHIGTQFIGEEDGVCTVKIQVKDTGIGISPEQQKRIFTSFEQAESSTSRKFGGTGLGLAISKHIVQLMGGEIRIESELGKGAAFIFTVKLKRGKEHAEKLLLPGVDWSNVRILAVDDDAELLEYFCLMAEQIGVTIDTAADGGDALRLIERNGPYNLYFIDWKIPGMNGIELSREIKKNYSGDSLVIMISASEWNEIAKEAEGAGINDFLPKPLFPSTVADCINKYIAREESPLRGDDKPSREESFPGCRILLAEDVEINREIILTMLGSLELDIECAVNGTQAVQMFEAEPERYDLIFMDLQMPEMDGIEATRRIRAFEAELNSARGTHARAPVPIIAMTANVFREDVEKCLEAGMNDHVGKPIAIDEVLKKLRDYLPVRDTP